MWRRLAGITAAAVLLGAIAPASVASDPLGPDQADRTITLQCVEVQCGPDTYNGDVVGEVRFIRPFDPEHPQFPNDSLGIVRYKAVGLWNLNGAADFWTLWLETESHGKVRVHTFNMSGGHAADTRTTFEVMIKVRPATGIEYTEAELFGEELVVEFAMKHDGDPWTGVYGRGVSPAP